MKNFILASASPRRKQILTECGVSCTVVPSDIDESSLPEPPPEKYVMELALLKGAQVAKAASKGDIIISADTVVVCEGEIMGKPSDFDSAKAMLMKLSGSWHSVLTGYCVMDAATGEASVRYEETKVKFREFSEKEALRYIRSGECMDKAGAYGIQEKGRLLVERIDGDFFNVVGLPICALAKLLKEDFGIDIL